MTKTRFWSIVDGMCAAMRKDEQEDTAADRDIRDYLAEALKDLSPAELLAFDRLVRSYLFDKRIHTLEDVLKVHGFFTYEADEEWFEFIFILIFGGRGFYFWALRRPEELAVLLDMHIEPEKVTIDDGKKEEVAMMKMVPIYHGLHEVWVRLYNEKSGRNFYDDWEFAVKKLTQSLSIK